MPIVYPFGKKDLPNSGPLSMAPKKKRGAFSSQIISAPVTPQPPVDTVIKMLAHRVYGAGYNSGAAPLTGDGTAKTFTSVSFQNESGATISKCSVVAQGWTLRTTGTTDASANVSTTWTIEYPSGTAVGTVTFDNVAGANSESPEVTLSTPIPAGATFRVLGSATPANGVSYIANLGFAGIRNHALRSTMKKAAIAMFGDSIATNNSGAIMNAATGRCAAYLNSITGTRADTYGGNGGANFVRQADLVAKLGVTHVFSNFGTNDFGAGVAVEVLQGVLITMRDMVRAAGAKWAHCTMLPRTNGTAPTVTASSVTSSSTTMTATVPDASKFVVGMAVSVAGATQTEYNGTKIVTAVNVGNNTVSLLFTGSGTTPATGTITLAPWKVSLLAGFMTPFNGSYNSGAGSSRGIFNAWVRSGVFDDYVEWADAVEPSRDAGRWMVAGESPYLPTPQIVTVSSVISTSRFNSDYDRGTNTVTNGVVQPITGANVGVLKGGSANTNGDITVVSAYANTQVVGDQYWVMPGVSYISDDGTHPRVSTGNKGGQILLDNVTAAKLDALLA